MDIISVVYKLCSMISNGSIWFLIIMVQAYINIRNGEHGNFKTSFVLSMTHVYKLVKINDFRTILL